MVHSVVRTSDVEPSELLGVPRDATLGDRMHFEVAKLLVERKLVSLTGLATAMRQAGRMGLEPRPDGDFVRRCPPIDYYRCVADVYGVRFIDLSEEPIDPALTDIKDRADYAERNIVPWRTVDGRLMIAATEITAENFQWADARFGRDNYDFVITSPFDILWETQKLFRDWDSFFAREALYSWKPEHSAKLTVTPPQKTAMWVMLAVLGVWR